MKARDHMHRREFLLPKARVLELSCERLFIQFADAQTDGRLPEFLDGVKRQLDAADTVRLTAHEWLAREDFREHISPLLRARRLLGATLLAAGLAASACSNTATGKSSGNGTDALPVNVIKVNPLELRREIEAVGTLAARDETVVSAEVEGRVARLAADMGDRVAPDAPLVILDAREASLPRR